jgi:hypothetical protein
MRASMDRELAQAREFLIDAHVASLSAPSYAATRRANFIVRSAARVSYGEQLDRDLVREHDPSALRPEPRRLRDRSASDPLVHQFSYGAGRRIGRGRSYMVTNDCISNSALASNINKHDGFGLAGGVAGGTGSFRFDIDEAPRDEERADDIATELAIERADFDLLRGLAVSGVEDEGRNRDDDDDDDDSGSSHSRGASGDVDFGGGGGGDGDDGVADQLSAPMDLSHLDGGDDVVAGSTWGADRRPHAPAHARFASAAAAPRTPPRLPLQGLRHRQRRGERAVRVRRARRDGGDDAEVRHHAPRRLHARV